MEGLVSKETVLLHRRAEGAKQMSAFIKRVDKVMVAK